MKKKVSLIILGAGGRGTIYANLAKVMSDKVKVVAVAEPREFFRNRIAEDHKLPKKHVFNDWKDVVKLPKFADAVVISTQDRMHVEPAIAFAELGYHILIEKPLAPDAESCRKIVEAVHKNNVLLSVCHVLRYSEYTQVIRNLVCNEAIGKILSIQHLEPVGHWRFAHSYVRGNWRKEAESSSILLAKSIHDLDWIAFIAGQRCKAISSFGSLMYFRKENKPLGSPERCVDCNKECPYHAPSFYLERFRKKQIDSYLESVSGELTEENIMEALRTGPYGRCVFNCDNDVADHQVVNMEFENGMTAVFTLAGCSQYGERRTTIFGSEGEIRCDGNKIEVYSYFRDRTTEIRIEADQGTLLTHHGGGDKDCLQSFVNAILSGDPEKIFTGADTSLETHYMVFAAEISRHERRTVLLDELRKPHAKKRK